MYEFYMFVVDRYGCIKLDIVVYGWEVIGLKISIGCKSLFGMSVVSLVVVGVVCLFVSVVFE